MKLAKGYIGCSTIILSLSCLLNTSCETFLDIAPPKSKLASESVFGNDVTATTAVTGIYTYLMSDLTFACGNPEYSILGLTGLSADELYSYEGLPNFVEFEENDLTSESVNIFRLWVSMYKAIFEANNILEKLAISSGVSFETKNQLLGEALFIRAFSHFYLVNLFGDVPLVVSTDYQQNSTLSRTSTSIVYEKIKEDLIEAKTLLSDNYPTSGRVRPNRATATALLSRVYLFTDNWIEAEKQATSIIDDSQYSLETELNNVFLASSKEAIWQLMPVYPGYNTNEGYYFLQLEADLKISDGLIQAFEEGDDRFNYWVNSVESGEGILYFPFKYKVQQGSDVTEYSMVFRLAEQYLIRSEARAQLNNIAGAQEDLNKIRDRAGLENTTANDTTLLLMSIEQERRIELFTEWGHRWFDLKRSGRVDEVLNVIKTSFSDTDKLYPIPQSEFDKNPRLGNQNPGY